MKTPAYLLHLLDLNFLMEIEILNLVSLKRGATMTKSELIDKLIKENPSLSVKVVEEGIKEILDRMMLSLEQGERVEVRGFGSFSLHFREPRIGRNPRTGQNVSLAAKAVPHFKAGKALKELVDGTQTLEEA